MSMKKIVIILSVVIMGCFASIEISYGETGQTGQSWSSNSAAIEKIGSKEILIPSHKADEWLVAHDYPTTTKKKRDFGLFGRPQSVMEYRDQTKEWEARTLRSLGLVEFFGGIGLAVTGIVIMDDSAGGGIAAILAGIGSAYIGYKDLSAAKRFFYQKSLFSRKDMHEDLMYRADRNKNRKGFSVHMNLASHEF